MKFAKTACSAYTLVEILIALAISLILMLGIAGLFQNVGTSLNDAQSTLLMTAELSTTNLTLQSDLAGVSPRVVNQPSRMTEESYVDEGGYFMIVDGMNAPPSKIGAGGTRISNQNVFDTDNSTLSPKFDHTVGAVDNILAFTATADPATPFRGLVDGTLKESTIAEIVWFVRGNTLYRRVLLVDDGSWSTGPNLSSTPFYLTHDVSVFLDKNGNLQKNTLETLKFRENRFGHYAPTTVAGKRSAFPYPLYRDNFEDWYYLRMPTLEETVHVDWNVAGQLDASFSPAAPGNTVYWDLWLKPNHWEGTGDYDQYHLTGSLNKYVEKDGTMPKPNIRAGEDIILNNVISFDVKVWNPYWVPLTDGTGWAPPQYIDMGQQSLRDENGEYFSVKTGGNFSGAPGPAGYGFTTKGKYGGQEFLVSKITYADDDSNKIIGLDTQGWAGFLMPCVYDSWTVALEQQAGNCRSTSLVDYYVDSSDPDPPVRVGAGVDPNNANRKDMSYWECPPPYDTPLKSIEITIRCFEPRSKNIRQTRITHSFE